MGVKEATRFPSKPHSQRSSGLPSGPHLSKSHHFPIAPWTKPLIQEPVGAVPDPNYGTTQEGRLDFTFIDFNL